MAPIRLFTDEDVYGSVASKLREKGLDAVSTPEVGRLGASDESQLAWATEEGRAILSFNVADFTRIHCQWLAVSRPHAGIVVARQRPIGDLLRRVEALVSSLDAEAMRDRLEYLSHW